MAKFNFEEYRQPWETGPHWELKREFMEKYSDMFPEDRLLCLAQAYSNIVIMNCSYPGPVMHQIRILAKPLEMCKKFQHNDFTFTDERNQEGNNQSVSGKMKLPQCFNRTLKKIKFCKSESSSDGTSSASQEVSEVCHSEGKMKVPHCFEKTLKEIKFCESEISSEDTLSSSQEVSEVFHGEEPPVLKLTETNSKSCKIGSSSNEVNLPLKKSKQVASELQGIISKDNREIFKLPAERFRNFLEKLQKIQARCKHPVACIISAANGSKIGRSISFKIVKDGFFRETKQFCATFSINGREISSEKGSSKNEAKSNVASSAIYYLINVFSDFMNVLKENGELNGEIANTSPENVLSDFKNVLNKRSELDEEISNTSPETVADTEAKVDQLQNNLFSPFALNRTLFDNSKIKGFALIIHYSTLSELFKQPMSVLQESAAFCEKSLNYVSDLVKQNSSSHTVHVLLNNEVVGTGTDYSDKFAKAKANANALDNLRKTYYSIKIKTEYMDAFAITRGHIRHGLSFSNNPISENSIGCKMLKNMGWQGGGLGVNGIAVPIEAKANNFTQGLGYGSQFNKRNVIALLKDYKKSDSFSDLIFSKEFTPVERRDIHMLTRKFRLRTCSYGKGNDRFLTIRKNYDVIDILQKSAAMGGSCGKFELVDLSNESVAF